jgi:hypothetical protein
METHGGKMSTRALLVWVLVLAASGCLTSAEAQTTAVEKHVAYAGRIKSSSGAAAIVRAGRARPAGVGDMLFQSDAIRTGADGQVSVMLQDNTRLSIGPGSEIALVEFQFAPADGRLALLLRVAQGVLSYVSGRIAKLAPASVKIETPKLVIGVRGTHALIKVEAP